MPPKKAAAAKSTPKAVKKPPATRKRKTTVQDTPTPKKTAPKAAASTDQPRKRVIAKKTVKASTPQLRTPSVEPDVETVAFLRLQNELKNSLGEFSSLLALLKFLPQIPKIADKEMLSFPVCLDSLVNTTVYTSILAVKDEEVAQQDAGKLGKVFEVDWCLIGDENLRRSAACKMEKMLGNRSLLPIAMKTASRMFGRILANAGQSGEGGKDSDSVVGRYFSGGEKEYFERVHEFFALIYPNRSKEIDVAELKANLPFKGRPTGEIVAYVKNLLILCEVYESSRLGILRDLIFYMFELDGDTKNDDFLADSEAFITDLEECSKLKQGSEMKDKVSLIFPVLLGYLDRMREKDDSRDLFENLLKPMMKTLLMRCHKTTHTQFLWFSFASAYRKNMEAFIDELWNLFHAGTDVEKVTATHYMGSFIARAKVVDLDHCLSWLQTMSEWCRRYDASKKKNTYYEHLTGVTWSKEYLHEETMHLPFFSACHMLFYVFAFRAKEFAASESARKWMNNNSIQNLTYSSLDPLRYCSHAVVSIFTDVCQHYKLDIFAPGAGKTATRGLEMESRMLTKIYPLITFFPFENFLIRPCSEAIKSNLREFESPVDIDYLAMERVDDLTKEMLAMEFIGGYDSEDISPKKKRIKTRR